MMGWRYVFATVKGTSHEISGTPCQDYASCQEWPEHGVWAGVVADGAGSALHAERGAMLACSETLRLVNDFLELGNRLSGFVRAHAEDLVVQVAQSINVLALEDNLSSRDFACTLLLAVVGADSAVFLQIGDGAIVIADEDTYTPVFWPQSGEYTNTTYFLTDEKVLDHIQFQAMEKVLEEVAVFSDGLQMLALQYSTRSVHSPFFRPMFRQLASSTEGHVIELCNPLNSFLNSKLVNERTDDDKTLVLATRRELISTPVSIQQLAATDEVL